MVTKVQGKGLGVALINCINNYAHVPYMDVKTNVCVCARVFVSIHNAGPLSVVALHSVQSSLAIRPLIDEVMCAMVHDLCVDRSLFLRRNFSQVVLLKTNVGIHLFLCVHRCIHKSISWTKT